MLSFGGQRIFLCRQAVDMRKAFDSLSDYVRCELGMDPFQGYVLVFIGKDHTRAKVLVWESTGFWLCAKRLETSRFQLPETVRGSGALPLSVAQVTVLLDEVLPAAAGASAVDAGSR